MRGRKKISDFDELLIFIKNNDIRIVLFGETHGFFPEELPFQKKILSLLKPNIIFYELFEEKAPSQEEIKLFLKKNPEEQFSLISQYKDLSLLQVAYEKGIPIRGCDIKNHGREDDSFKTRTSWTKEQEKEEEKLMQEREVQQQKIFLEELKKNELIFASVGLYHLRAEVVEQFPFSFVIITPQDGDKPISQETKKISFSIEGVLR